MLQHRCAGRLGTGCNQRVRMRFGLGRVQQVGWPKIGGHCGRNTSVAGSSAGHRQPTGVSTVMALQSDGLLLTMVLLWRPHEEGRNECTQSSPMMEAESVWWSFQRRWGWPRHRRSECPSSCRARPKLLGSDVGVPCWRAVQQGRSPCPSLNSGLRWGQVQFHLCKRCCVRTGVSGLCFSRVVDLSLSLSLSKKKKKLMKKVVAGFIGNKTPLQKTGIFLFGAHFKENDEWCATLTGGHGTGCGDSIGPPSFKVRL